VDGNGAAGAPAGDGDSIRGNHSILVCGDLLARHAYNALVSTEILVEGADQLPEYSSGGCAGADLFAAQPAEIPPAGRVAVATGLKLQIPEGHVGLVWPRSGLALRNGIDTLAGVIDADYRGEVRVVLVNHGREPFRIECGDRVAQLLIQPVARARFVRTTTLSETGRGAQGFGSTGR
jgi:dUTP pyrophosphatase